MVLKSDEAALLMLPLLVDGRVDAADRPVQKEPAELAHRRRPRGLLQQHTKKCSLHLRSPQNQTEMTDDVSRCRHVENGLLEIFDSVCGSSTPASSCQDAEG